ncbi:MAG: o-succinylbenzoate--CoA ligase [Anaerolineaceae bacterium]|nr:o-succinylbenzoate--CoA ligase [Anaerolineaceae bacterium]
MQDWLTARAQATPDKVALITNPGDGAHELTFAQLAGQVRQMARQWIAAGIEPGQRVAVLAITWPLTVVQLFTAMRLDCVLVPINIRLTLDEIDQQLRLAECDWLLPYGLTDTLGGLHERGHKIANLDVQRKVAKKVTLPDHDIDLSEPLAIIHTSGTSGTPKGAVLTYGNFYQSAMASAYRLGVLPEDRWLCVLPLYHVGGLSILIRSVLYGTAVDLVEKFDVDAINRKLTEEPITLVSLVPTMLYRLLEARTQPWNDQLRLVLLGGAAPSAELLQRCHDEGVPVATTYGLTEAASQVATAGPELARRKPGTVGKPLLFTQVKVVKETGGEAKPGDYGEVLVSGPTVMQGYYNNPDATDKTLKNGWLHTGDIGYLDDDGDLFLVQRRSDLIVTGGENVYPVEVEAVLRGHPAIKEVAVTGLDHPEWGQQVAAALVINDNMSVSDEDLITYCRDHLAGYKIPRHFLKVGALPQTGSGKIQRGALRELFIEQQNSHQRGDLSP